MQLVCPCLNVTINVVVEDPRHCFDEAIVKPDSFKQLGLDAVEDDFFSLCSTGSIARLLLDIEKGIVEKLPVLIKRRRIDRWEIRKCIVCNADVYALGSPCAGQVLVNTKLLLHDESVIAERRKSAEISPVFQVILPKMKDDFGVPNCTDTNNTAGNRSGFTNGAAAVVSKGALHAIQNCVSQYLRKEQEAMEERIRLYTEQQQVAFDQLKANAKMEKAKTLSLLAQHGGGIGAGLVSYESHWSSSGSNSFGGTGLADDDFDSAVPLSPISLASGGDPSPAFDTSKLVGGSLHLPTDLYGAPLRPKAHSNPASLSGWKRKRHSGGPGLPPSLTSHPEEQQDIFSFEEQENDELNQTSYLPADDEGDTTDDSGTGEEYNKYYPPPPPPPSVNASTATLVDHARTISQSSNVGALQYCTSLPVRVPVGPMDRFSMNRIRDVQVDGEIEEENDEGMPFIVQPKDVGANIQALARSIQGADDPERLFGERPQRRRWKTGEHFQQELKPQPIAKNVWPETQHRKGAVVVVFKEEQNF